MRSAANDKIRFHYIDVSFAFRRRSHLKQFLLDLFVQHKKEVQAVNYIFCDDDYLTDLNKRYLNHNTLTDIITFELSSIKDPVLADIYISIPRVKENAVKFSSSFNKELYRVIFHGALHLIGFKDKSLEEMQTMREEENLLLDSYGISRTSLLG